MCAALIWSFRPNISCFSFLNTFACCYNFFTYPSSLISHPGFIFLFGFLWATPIQSRTKFAPAWISSFNSVMFLVVVFGYNLFNFSLSSLTFFQSSFLGEGNIVFFSVMIFFNSTFIWFSFVNIYYLVLRCVVFRFSVFRVSIQLTKSCFSVSSLSDRVGDLVDNPCYFK